MIIRDVSSGTIQRDSGSYEEDIYDVPHRRGERGDVGKGWSLLVRSQWLPVWSYGSRRCTFMSFDVEWHPEGLPNGGKWLWKRNMNNDISFNIELPTGETTGLNEAIEASGISLASTLIMEQSIKDFLRRAAKAHKRFAP